MWGQKTEVDVVNGAYLKNLKLVEMRLKDLLHLYLEKAMHKSKRPKILKYDVEMLRRSPLARYSLLQLTPVKICEFRDERLRAGKSTSTVRNYLKLLSRAITIGQKELGIPLQNNPFKMVEYPRPAPSRERTLNALELNRLFKACAACSKFHFLRAFVECLYLTICRRSELIKLSRHDVDWSNSTAILKETKDQNKSRVIGLSPRVVELLQQLPRTIDGQFFPVGSISAFEKAFGRAVKRAAIADFHMHDIRHTGATDLAESGWSTVELMQQGGWTSASMVKRYANISPKHLARKLKQVQ
tara:strand:+ start:441 stop:1340 length:900 start_codon:yes stop_codon:yes gene_type:complete